jgi:hypothetical protein
VRHTVLIILLFPFLLLSQTTTEESSLSNNLYLKGAIITGSGSDEILVGRVDYTDSEKESEDIYVEPGGGTGLEAVIGYNLTNALALEFAIGWCNTGETLDGDNNILFNRAPVRASAFYRFNTAKKWFPYIGGGLSSNLHIKYSEEIDGKESEVTYKKTIGFHLLGGIEYKSNKSPWFGYGELRVIQLGEYTVDKSDFSSGLLEEFGMDNPDANGVQVSIGAGYYIN